MTQPSAKPHSWRRNIAGFEDAAHFKRIFFARGGHPDRIRQIYSFGPITVVVSVAMAALLVGKFWGEVPLPFILGWFAYAILIVGGLFYQYKTVDTRRFKKITRAWRIHLSIFAACLSLLWTVPAVAAVFILEAGAEILVISSLIVIMTGNAIVLGIIPSVGLISQAVGLGPPILCQFLSGDADRVGVGFALLVVFWVHFHFSLKYSDTLAQDEDRRQQRKKALDRLAEAHLKIRALAETDPVTGLSNRRSFMDRLATIHQNTTGPESGNYACFLIDLDHFKHLNDAYGHAAGDRHLCRIAHSLSEAVGTRGTVARLGGDEFAVVSETPMSHAAIRDLGDDIRAALFLSAELDGNRVFSGGSVGVALFPEHAGSVSEWMLFADHSLREAKTATRGSVRFFSAEDKDVLLEHHELSLQLESAVRRGDIAVRYQPLFALGDGTLAGLEALAIWPREDGDAVSPERFFKLAEESGIVMQLCDAIFQQVARDVRGWVRAGLTPPSISLNIHPAQIHHQQQLLDSVGVVREALNGAAALVIEVTEDCIIGRGSEDTLDVLFALKDAGCRLSLDDFGTGYASLTHLKALPIDEIKIDRNFVRDLEEGNRDLRVVESIVYIAELSEITVVAEGIETQQQLELARACGVTIGQGYLLSRPLEPGACHRFLAHAPRSTGGLSVDMAPASRRISH